MHCGIGHQETRGRDGLGRGVRAFWLWHPRQLQAPQGQASSLEDGLSQEGPWALWGQQGCKARAHQVSGCVGRGEALRRERA